MSKKEKKPCFFCGKAVDSDKYMEEWCMLDCPSGKSNPACFKHPGVAREYEAQTGEKIYIKTE